jgi:hypothetical protein
VWIYSIIYNDFLGMHPLKLVGVTHNHSQHLSKVDPPKISVGTLDHFAIPFGDSPAKISGGYLRSFRGTLSKVDLLKI